MAVRSPRCWRTSDRVRRFTISASRDLDRDANRHAVPHRDRYQDGHSYAGAVEHANSGDGYGHANANRDVLHASDEDS